MEEKVPTPVVQHAEVKKVDPKLSTLKTALLYVLIGGLVISALISVISILIGEFSEAAGKALLTTIIFVTHSLLVIGIISADQNNRLGKDLVPTVILATVIANMFTSTLGIWELWQNDASWKAFLVYMLLIGSAFIVTASLRLRLGLHKATNALAYTTTGLIVLLTALLIPWIVVSDPSIINSFYYRLIGATTILAATSISLTVIFNRIGASQHQHVVKKEKPLALPSGMMAIYVSIGVIVGLFWFYGLFAFIAKAANVDRQNRVDSSLENRDYYNRYR